jgi:hypothetical protein
MDLRLLSRLSLALGLALSSGCDDGAMIGRVTSKDETSPGTYYLGEITITSTGGNSARAMIGHGMRITVRRPLGFAEPASFASIAVGDSVVAWRTGSDKILASAPPVVSFDHIEIIR